MMQNATIMSFELPTISKSILYLKKPRKTERIFKIHRNDFM